MELASKRTIPKKYWLTPKAMYEKLDAEFHFDYDPCPWPTAGNALVLPWGQSNYVNPPFRRRDGLDGQGPTAFVHKAIEQQKLGRSSVVVLPVQSYIMLAAEAGAEIRSMGRVRWEEVQTKEPCRSPSPIVALIFRGGDA